MRQPVVPITKVTVRQSSYAFAWWPHPLYSTIHNHLTESYLPLMFHYWPVCVNGSPNQSVWEPYEFQMKGVRKKGKRARPCPGMWDIRGCACVCVCAQGTCLCCLCMFGPVYTLTHTQSQLPLTLHGYFWPAQSARDMEGRRVNSALSPLVPW